MNIILAVGPTQGSCHFKRSHNYYFIRRLIMGKQLYNQQRFRVLQHTEHLDSSVYELHVIWQAICKNIIILH